MLPGVTRSRHARRWSRAGCPAGRLPAVLLLYAASSAAQPEPSAVSLGAPPADAATATLRIGNCDELPRAELAAALAARLGRPVDVAPPELAADGAWIVELRAGVGGPSLRLRAPDGVVWVRPVELPRQATATERLRIAALAAEYLLALAAAPFGPPGEVPAGPPTIPAPAVELDRTRPPAVAPLAVLEPPPAAGPPVVRREEPGGRLDGTLLLGGASDLSTAMQGSSAALVLGVRPELEWPGGLWLLLEVGWHYAEAEFVEPLRLHQLPVRFGVGGAVQSGRATFRLALQGVFEAWWSTGGTPRADWRSGGGLLLSGGYRLLPWLAVGGELGGELLPHGVELWYGETPVFSLGSWRWRGLLWVSVGGDLGL